MPPAALAGDRTIVAAGSADASLTHRETTTHLGDANEAPNLELTHKADRPTDPRTPQRTFQTTGTTAMFSPDDVAAHANHAMPNARWRVQDGPTVVFTPSETESRLSAVERKLDLILKALESRGGSRDLHGPLEPPKPETEVSPSTTPRP